METDALARKRPRLGAPPAPLASSSPAPSPVPARPAASGLPEPGSTAATTNNTATNTTATTPWRLETFSGRLVELSGGPATAALTMAFRLVLEAQRQGEPVAWINEASSSFFPPDASDNGVDLDTLVVVRLPGRERVRDAGARPDGARSDGVRPDGRRQPAGRRRSARRDTGQGRLERAIILFRAADQLVRSGGFGLIVIDLGPDPGLPLGVQSRLAGLAKKHDAAVVCLTEKSHEHPSLGPLVSLRLEAERAQERSAESASERAAESAAASAAATREPAARTPGRVVGETRVLKDKRDNGTWRHAEELHVPDGLC